MNELRSIEYSNDLQFSRPWKGNGLGCGQPYIACKKLKQNIESPVLVYENPWAMNDSRGCLRHLTVTQKRHEAIPKFFKCSLGQRPIGTFKSHVMQSRDLYKVSDWLSESRYAGHVALKSYVCLQF